MEREAEIQTLMRKLGPEAMSWLDGNNCNDTEPLTQSKLSVPTIRRDMPSTTEVTDMTSVGSITSTHADMDNHNNYQDTTKYRTIVFGFIKQIAK